MPVGARWLARRTIAAFGSLGVLAIVTMALVLTGPHAHTPAGAAPGALRCATPAPTSAAGYAEAMNRLDQAGDAALSVALPSGRVAWIYADTFMPGVAFPHSTVIMQDGGCFTPTRTQLLPDDADGTYWWPGAAVTLPDGDVLITAGDGYGAQARAAIAREVSGALVFDHWLHHWPQGGAHGPVFTAGLLVDGDQLRAYGTRLTGTTLGKELWLASVPLRGLESGIGWQVGVHAGYGALPHGTDSTVAAYRDADGYHLITLQDCVFGGGPLVSLDSSLPGGPFTVRPLLSYNRPGQWRYNAAVHPEAKLADGKLLVTINNNWPLEDKTVHPLATYQPTYFEVTR